VFSTKAWEEFRDHITKQSNTAQSFQGYGSEFIKQAGHSPDAYVQVAMQLATFRLFGEQAGTYEATQVRPFLHGRTETTRTVSLESEAFVKKMGFRPKRDEDNPQARQKSSHCSKKQRPHMRNTHVRLHKHRASIGTFSVSRCWSRIAQSRLPYSQTPYSFDRSDGVSVQVT
jgi:hypothetical protein